MTRQVTVFNGTTGEILEHRMIVPSWLEYATVRGYRFSDVEIVLYLLDLNPCYVDYDFRIENR